MKGKNAMKCKITVLRKTHHPDLAEQYTLHNKLLCDALAEGQEFIVTNMAKSPEGFCAWAWLDIQRWVQAIMLGGDFSQHTGWMKEGGTWITCCTDGIRPVIFKLERLDETNE
jgi:uncharacterized repeat protein (TIGR04076 family)